MSDLIVKYTEKGNHFIWLDTNANAARTVLRRYPPEMRALNPIHIGIVGFGELGQALLFHAAQTLVLPDESPIRATVFVQDRRQVEYFIRKHPALNPANRDHPAFGQQVPLLEIHSDEYAEPAPTLPALESAHRAVPFSAIYICVEHDHEALTACERLLQSLPAIGLHCPIVCCLPGDWFESADQALEHFKHLPPEYRDPVKFFHLAADQFHPWEQYPGEALDIAGILINKAYTYFTQHGAKPIAVMDSDFAALSEDDMKAWYQREEPFRISSRASGDHIWQKLRWLGYVLDENSPGPLPPATLQNLEECFKLLAEDLAALDQLCRLEHRRFVAERLMNGWLRHDETLKPLRLNATSVPYDALPENEKHKDEVIILSLPAIVRALLKISEAREPDEKRRLRLYGQCAASRLK